MMTGLHMHGSARAGQIEYASQELSHFSVGYSVASCDISFSLLPFLPSVSL